jgi:pimeloyl-ACP methyl ester carboxylesterase
MLGFTLLLLTGLVIALSATVLLVMHRLRRPPRRTYAAAVARNIPGDPSEAIPSREFRAFTFDAPPGGRPGKPTSPRTCWEITGENPAGPVIICSPGWGDSKVGAIPRLAALAPGASSIIAWDSAGLGESPGLCRLGSRADALELAALAESLQRPDVILLGWSLGAGTSIAAGVELSRRGRAPLAVIAEAPYRMPWTPARSVLRLAGLPHTINLPIAMWLLGLRLGEGPTWRRFDRALLAPELACPLLLLHGEADDICPEQDSRDIADAARNAQLTVIPRAGHNNLWTEEPYKTEAREAVMAFIRSQASRV